MADTQCLAVHLSQTQLHAVLATKSAQDISVLSDFALALDDKDLRVPADLINQLAQQLRGTCKGTDVALTLGSSFYQSQLHHTEFTDLNQIRQTLRFDIEEECLSNAESMAVCFEVLGASDTGTDIIVHTAARDKLDELFTQCDSAGLDALVAQPDLAAWLNYLRRQRSLPADQPLVFVACTGAAFYLLVLDAQRQLLLARSCTCATPDHLYRILTRELICSLASLPADQRPKLALYHAAGLDPEKTEQALAQVPLKSQPLEEPNCARAFALGAAISLLDQQPTADFRADGLPPRSLVTARRYALWALSAAASIFMIFLIIVLHTHDHRHRSASTQAIESLHQAWRNVNPGDRLPRSVSTIAPRISHQLKQIDTESRFRSIAHLPDSVDRAFLVLLNTMNDLPADFDLRIKSLQLRADTATLSGAVTSLLDSARIHDIIQANPQLEIESWYIQQSGSGTKDDPSGMRTFNMSLHVNPPAAAVAD